jgi:hypothetical protein
MLRKKAEETQFLPLLFMLFALQKATLTLHFALCT